MTRTAVGHDVQVHPKSSPPANDSPGIPRGLLVVDDEPAVRGVLATAMRQQGYDVWLAAGGDEAVALYREHRQHIDVVLLDVQMPGRDGPGTLAALREVDPGVNVHFMSGYTGIYTEENLLEMGAKSVLQKPFRLNDLAEKLRPVSPPIEYHDSFQEDRWEDDGGQGHLPQHAPESAGGFA